VVPPATPVTLKKRILRTVIEEILADVDDSAKKITLKIHWVGGVHTALRIPKNYTGGHRRVAEGEVVDRVRELVQVCSDPAIASILNRLGYHTGVGNTWTETRVVTLRRERDITGHQKLRDDSWVTLSGAAKELKVCPGVVRKLVTRKILPATQVVQNGPWIIKRENLRLEEVQQYIAAVHAGKNVPRRDNGQIKLSL